MEAAEGKLSRADMRANLTNLNATLSGGYAQPAPAMSMAKSIASRVDRNNQPGR
jgi:hypothetical protein